MYSFVACSDQCPDPQRQSFDQSMATIVDVNLALTRYSTFRIPPVSTEDPLIWHLCMYSTVQARTYLGTYDQVSCYQPFFQMVRLNVHPSGQFVFDEFARMGSSFFC